jgi:HEAT repeat protein
MLVEGSQQPRFRGISQSGAYRGIAATRRREALELLLDQSDYGKQSNRIRPSITAALADIGKGLEKADRELVIEALTDLLRDPWQTVRWQAARGLVSMEAPDAIPALEAFSRTLSKQGEVAAEKMLAVLRESDKSDGSTVKKRVEDLSEKVRKLEDQLQKLEARVNKKEADSESSG